MKNLLLFMTLSIFCTMNAFATNPGQKHIVMCNGMKSSLTYKIHRLVQPTYPPKNITFGEVKLGKDVIVSGNVSENFGNIGIQGNDSSFYLDRVSSGHYDLSFSYVNNQGLFVSGNFQNCRVIVEVTGASAHN